jgi:hypothetical protein
MTSRLFSGLSAALAGAVIMAAAPASPASAADTCIRLNGGSFSGDIGFFRFRNVTLPTEPDRIVTLAGRAAGLSPAWGSAVTPKSGDYVELGVMFFIDGVQGQFNVSFFPPTATRGSGRASYGEYGTSDSVTARIVGCGQEP